ncbi:MAG: hypothetical protein OXC91_06635 [Rhodobacteraceae bacterium]|nr:hypothetical protein [Paracoccaceae bacterium]
MPRSAYKYHFKKGHRIVHTGVTNNLKRREAEHRQTYGGGHIAKVGSATSRDMALRWERQQVNRGRPIRRRLPL